MKARHIFNALSYKQFEELQIAEPRMPRDLRTAPMGGYSWTDIPKEHRNAIGRTICSMFERTKAQGYSVKRKHYHARTTC